jgi:chemotaxis protein methyltransferase WspC
MNFQRLRTLLERHYGWATEAIHDRELQNAVQAQADAMSLDFKTQPERVLSILCQDSGQLAKLAQALAVHETWFFRGIAQLKHAVDFLAAKRFERNNTSGFSPLRILSAPCSTGEEAYSLAILLWQRGLTPRDVIIDGFDQSELAIEKARLALYPQNSFRELQWNIPNNIAGLHTQGDRWQVDSDIASMVHFRVANLLELPNSPGLYDCIFCRNLLIYLSQSKRLELLHRLAQWLTPHGVLYVSAVEAPIALEAGLIACPPLEFQIFTPGKPRTTLENDLSFLPPKRIAAESPSFDPPASSRWTTKRPALSVPATAIEPVLAEHKDISIARAEEAANAGRFSEAEAILNSISSKDQFSAEAQFLRGVIAQAQGKLDEAQFAWEQAVYLDPQHGPALQRLWLAATSRGDNRLAEQYRRRWLKRRDPS